MMRSFLFLAFTLIAASPVLAGPVRLDVRDAAGKPLEGAVVFVDGPPKPAGPIHFPWSMSVAQQNIAFQPHVLIVPVGTSVSFPNHDRVRHHVYSFSKAKRFELKLYGRDETRSITFDVPGLVALGCNIHDSMSGFLWVVDTPFVGNTDAQGHVAIPNVPAGKVTFRVWHPSIRAPSNFMLQSAAVGPGGYAGQITVAP